MRILSGDLSAVASIVGPSNCSSISGAYSRDVKADQHTADSSNIAATLKAYFTASLTSPGGAMADTPNCVNAHGSRLPTTAPTLAKNMYIR
jgi:hypothetical protein